MNGSGGLVSQILAWGTHPMASEGTIGDWLAGIVLILIASFLWAQVIRQID
jgi:hypothetical protein